MSYVDAIKETFEKFPDQLAFAFMGMKMKIKELDQYANRLAHMLLSHGLKKGDVVGINLPNIPEYLIAWLGTLKAGCVASGVSPLLSTEEMEHQLKDSDARALVTVDAIFAGRLVDRSKDMIIVSGYKVFSKKAEDALAQHPAIDSAALIGIPDPKRPASELVKAYIMLTAAYAQKDKETLKADILKMAAQKLAPYEVPKTIEFLAEPPLTTVGKIDKKLLRARARAEK